MVEVFKTNVKDQDIAALLVKLIHQSFAGYSANFDLEDCDHILRVKSRSGYVQSPRIIQLMRDQGCYAEVLEDVSLTVTSK